MSDDIVTMKNVGPISFLRLRIPEEGGVVLLRGPNGSGKSTAISAVHALTGGADPVPVRDGEEQAEIIGLGARLVVGKRRKLSGELTVEAISSDIDPGVLIDPGIKDPESADMERARVLCALAGVEPKIEHFATLAPLGEAIDQVASTKAHGAKSLPEMAKWLKFDLEREAQKLENRGDLERREAEGLANSIKDVDLTAHADEKELAYNTEQAIRELATMEQQAAEAQRANASSVEMKKQVEALRAEHGKDAVSKAQITLDAAKAEAESLQASFEKQMERIREMEKQYQEETKILELARVERDVAGGVLMNSQAHLAETIERDQKIAKLEQQIDALPKIETAPDEAAITEARTEVEAMRRQQERGVIVRRALVTEEKRKELEAKASKTEELAAAWRSASKKVWNVVTDAVARVSPQGLTFENCRIYLTTPDRGRELFDDLSDGERGRIAIAACVEATPEGGILAMAQHVTESLDPENLQYAASIARAKKVTILSGKSDVGMLRAELFS